MSLVATYKRIAAANSADLVRFKQGPILDSYPAGQRAKQGVCRALCMYEASWSKYQFPHFRDEMLTLANDLADMQNLVVVGADRVDTFTRTYQKLGTTVGLDFVNLTHLPHGGDTWLQGVASHCTRLPYYVQIVLPNHVVGVHPHKDGGVAFFDPNVGMIRCPRAELFFILHAIFHDGFVSQTYALQNNPEIFLVDFR